MVDHERRFKDKVPQHDASLADTPLADTPRVMGEALDDLADLYDATRALGEALVDAGLPRRAWRSEQAALRLLSNALPKIPVGAFLLRLEEFATREGPTCLRGDHRDLRAFHEEVDILSDVARPLQDVVYRLHHAPVDPRNERPLQRVMRQPRLQAPLGTITEILGDFEALAPFMQPLTPEQWHALSQSQAHGPLPAGTKTIGTTASRPRTHRLNGASLSSRVKAVAAAVRPMLGVVPTRLLQRVPSLRRWPRAGRWLAAAGLLLAVVVAVLTLSHRSHTPPGVLSASSPSVPLTALAGSGTATASAKGSHAPSPTPGATAPAGSTPKLALTCVLNGATATLTVKNLGSSSLTWQAQSPPTLTVSPMQGTLEAGQSAAVQVSAKNKKTAVGTITVIASHDSVSTQDKVSCR